MGACTFCRSSVGLRSVGSSHSVQKGLEGICNALQIPLETGSAERYTLCPDCSLAFQQIYEFKLEMEVLQLKIEDRVKQVYIAVLQNPVPQAKKPPGKRAADSDEPSPLGPTFSEKCKALRQNPTVRADILPNFAPGQGQRKVRKAKTSSKSTSQHFEKDPKDDAAENLKAEPEIEINPDGIVSSEDMCYEVRGIKQESEHSDAEDRASDHSFILGGSYAEQEADDSDGKSVDEILSDPLGSDKQDDDENKKTESVSSKNINITPTPSSGRYQFRRNVKTPQKYVDESELKDNKELACPYCPNQEFRTAKEFVRHMKHVHHKSDEDTTTTFPKSDRGPLACPHCPRSFRQSGGLASHIMFKHSIVEPLDCPLDCGRKFINKGRLSTHMRDDHRENKTPLPLPTTVDGKRSLNCDTCGRTFKKLYSLQMHIKTVHNLRKDYRCSHCQEEFRYRSTYLNHLRTEHNENEDVGGNSEVEGNAEKKKRRARRKPSEIGKRNRPAPKYDSSKPYNVECSQCDQKFTSEANRNLHVKYVHEPRTAPHVHWKNLPKECETCKLKFANHRQLRCHIRTVHEKIKDFACKHCGREFLYRTTWREHLRLKHPDLEPDAKPYRLYTPVPAVCGICNRTCSSRHTLATHMRTHTKDKPFQCDEENCGKAFTNKFNLMSHKVTGHGAEGNYKCTEPGCGKSFYIRRSYDAHVLSHAGIKSLICHRCGKGLAGPASMRKHLRFHDKQDKKNDGNDSLDELEEEVDQLMH